MMQIKSTIQDGFPFVVHTTSDLSPKMKAKFHRAVNIASMRLKKDKLQDFIYSYSYNTYVTRGFWFWKRVVAVKKKHNFHVDVKSDIFATSKYEILKIIQEGNELQLGEGSDNEGDVFWRLDNRHKSGVIGYTYRNTIWQYTYKNWAEKMSDEVLAGHLVHEWLHKLGGEHAYKNHSLRKHTVTYAVGYYVAGKFN